MKELNINNLLSFWRLAGSKAGAYHISSYLEVSTINNSDWPNRIWVTSVQNDEAFNVASKLIRDIHQQHRFSLFHEEAEKVNERMHAFDLELISSQTGMNLSLDHWTLKEIIEPLKMIRVSTPKEAYEWSELFKVSFGYTISGETVTSLLHDVSFFTIYHQEHHAGTAILYCTGNVAGIHGLGVLPNMRGKGIAKSTMEALLNEAKLKGLEFACLQASDAAFNMYKHLGFIQEFKMSNYQIKKQ